MTTYSLRLRAGSIPLVGQALGVGAGVMYATIEAGRVTAVNFGPLPSSTDTVLYFDLTGYAIPAVDDYFSDVCQTFSSLPPVIPAGDLAPPYTPGGTPPDPDGPDYPVPELPPEDDPEPLASTAPTFLSFHADSVESIAITGTGDITEVSPLMRSIVRIQDICAVRLHTMVDTPDAALELVLCFSVDDGATWEELSVGKTGPSVTLAAAGAVAGAFVNVDPAVAGDTLLSICVRGTGSAVVGNVFATLFVKTSAGACIVIDEDIGCPLSGTYTEGIEFDFPDLDTFAAGLPYSNLFNYWAGDTTDTARQYLDQADLFNNHPCIVSKHGDGGTPQNLYWRTTFGDTRNERAAFMLISLDPAIASQVGDGVSPDQFGFLMFRFYGDSGATATVHLLNDRIYVAVNSTLTDIGPASDLCDGTKKAVIFQVQSRSLGFGGPYQIDAALFIDDPCTGAAPTFYGGVTKGVTNYQANYNLLVCHEWFDAEEIAETRLWQYAHGPDSNSFFT